MLHFSLCILTLEQGKYRMYCTVYISWSQTVVMDHELLDHWGSSLGAPNTASVTLLTPWTSWGSWLVILDWFMMENPCLL